MRLLILYSTQWPKREKWTHECCRTFKSKWTHKKLQAQRQTPRVRAWMDWGPKVSEMAEFNFNLITPHSICQLLSSVGYVCVYMCAWKNQRQMLICYPKIRKKQASEHLDKQTLEPDRQWEDRPCITAMPLITATCPDLLDHRYYMPGDLYLTHFRVKDVCHCTMYQKNPSAFLGNLFHCRWTHSNQMCGRTLPAPASCCQTRHNPDAKSLQNSFR